VCSSDLIDIAEEFIDEARAVAASASHPPAEADATDFRASAQFMLGDMRSIEGLGVYDGAFCFGNSFGFLEYADMEKFLTGVARALKRGARFIVNTGMAAESVLPDFEEQSCHEVGDITLTIKERYRAEESCVDSEYIFERDGETDSRKAKHWIYTVAEIRRMLERAGFTVLSCLGSLDGEPYKLGSRELFVVAEVSVPGALRTDTVAGAPGTDTVASAPGTDPVAGAPGTDTVASAPGTDTVAGAPGTDTVASAPWPTAGG